MSSVYRWLANTVLEKFNLHKLRGRSSISYGENIIDFYKKEELFSTARRSLIDETLLPKLERIYVRKPKNQANGHPVHYIIETDDIDTRREVYKLLLNALYLNNQLKSKRYAFLDIKPGAYFATMGYDALYNSCVGGAVVVRYLADDDSDQDDVSFGETEAIIDLITEYVNSRLNKYLNVL